MNTGGGEREPWLPDLCRLPRLVVMLSMAELIVVVLALAPDGGARWTWSRAATDDGVTVLYDVERRDGSDLSLALHFDRYGDIQDFMPPPRARLPTTGSRNTAGASHG